MWDMRCLMPDVRYEMPDARYQMPVYMFLSGIRDQVSGIDYRAPRTPDKNVDFPSTNRDQIIHDLTSIENRVMRNENGSRWGPVAPPVFKTACGPVKRGWVGSTPTYSRYISIIITICCDNGRVGIVTIFVTFSASQGLLIP